MTWGSGDDYGDRARYQLAAICERGHVLTADAELHPAAKFCSECGALVLTACPRCETAIRGHFVPAGVAGVGGSFDAPAYCYSCGQPFPWTAAKLAAAKDLADELEGADPDVRTKLKTALDDIASRGPQSEVGAARLKKMLTAASSGVGGAIWKISVDIASEAAKKILLGH